MLKKCRAWALALYLLPGWAVAATMYEWTDESGQAHLGYRPPPGVVGRVVGEKTRQPTEPINPVNCRALQEEHLRLIDKEIARLRSVPTGLTAEFEFTAEAKQRFINDLLAHRAAFVTGRMPDDFIPPDNKRQLVDLKTKYTKDKAQLVEELEAQARQLQQQHFELERQRQENEALMLRNRSLYPRLP